VQLQFGSIEIEFMSPVNSTVQGQGREEYIQTRYCNCIFIQICAEFGIRILYRKLSSKCEFRENKLSNGHARLRV